MTTDPTNPIPPASAVPAPVPTAQHPLIDADKYGPLPTAEHYEQAKNVDHNVFAETMNGRGGCWSDHRESFNNGYAYALAHVAAASRAAVEEALASKKCICINGVLGEDGTGREVYCDDCELGKAKDRASQLQADRDKLSKGIAALDEELAFERKLHAEKEAALARYHRLSVGSNGAGEEDGWSVAEKYNELIYAVARKFPNETRHQTALRYIRSAEELVCGPAQSIKPTSASDGGGKGEES
jgi:hypothetical protein